MSDESRPSLPPDGEGAAPGAAGAAPAARSGAPGWDRFVEAILGTNAVLLSGLDRGHRFVFWNPGAERITGYAREEVLGGGGALEFIYPDEEYRRFAQEQRERVIRGEPADAVLLKVRTKDGRERTLSFYSRQVRDAEGRPLGLANVAVDVTEREAAERALRESEARYRALFDTMTEGVAVHRVVFDEAGAPVDYVVTNANPAYEAHTGIRPADAVGRRASELYGTGKPPYLDVFGRVATTGLPERIEVFFGPMGRHFRVLVVSPAPGEFATVFEDVTAARELERALREANAALVARNEELDAFAHTVAHDLKNPLSAVLGFAEHLEPGAGTLSAAERAESAEGIVRSARKMQEIIDALLLVGESRADVPLAPVPLAPLVEDCLRAFEHEARRLRAEVRRPGSWPTPLGYAPWVERVLANYFGNALRYGGRPPRIELGAEALDGSRVKVWVRDDGRGIAPGEAERLFVPFSRLSRGEPHGHGLGLSIVRRLVERMGGTVGVESAGRPGEGSTFHFTLPAA